MYVRYKYFGKYFGFPYGIDRWHYILSLSRFLDRFVPLTGLVTYENARVKYKAIFC